jgi:hypothetical protein
MPSVTVPEMGELIDREQPAEVQLVETRGLATVNVA